MELKLVHNPTGDDDMVDRVDSPRDDEERIAAAHHRFEDDVETISLLSTTPSLGKAEVVGRCLLLISGLIF